jgi:hypothetical protein
MQYEYSPMQLAEVSDFSFLRDWDTIRIMPEGYGEIQDEEDQQGYPTKAGSMQRVRIKGIAAFNSTPAEYMRDMLRYDDGTIEAIWDYPDSQLTYHLPFTAIVQLKGYTPERWRSFGLVTDVLGDVGTESPQGYTVDEWIADRSPVQD